MSIQVSGTYQGEGPNVSAPTGASAAPALTPDVSAQTNSTPSGVGRNISVAADRRSRLRVSSEGARAAVAINVSSADQQLAQYARGFYCSGGGNLVVRLCDDTSDVTFTGVVAGVLYPLCISIVRKTNTTASGLLLY